MKEKVGDKQRKSVANLKQGEKGIIRELLKSASSLHLLELGCLPGTEVSLTYKAPFGGVLCLELGGFPLFLNTEEAQTLALAE